MRFRNGMTWLALMSLTAVAVAGCTSDKTASNEGSTADSTQTAASPSLDVIGSGALTYDPGAAVNDGQNISLEFWTIPSFESIYKKYTAAYSKIHPNVKFKVTNLPIDDYYTKLAVALQSGKGPDIFFTHNSHNELLAFSQPYPDAVLPLEALKSDFAQVESHIIDGNLYYIDAGIMTSEIFYNKKMWQDAGLTEADIPKTWDQLIAVAQKLTVTQSGKIAQCGFNYNDAYQFLLGAMNLQKGVRFFEADGKTPILDRPEVLENAQLLYDMYAKQKVCTALNGEKSEQEFGSGKAAMVYSWGWLGGFLQQNFPDLEYGTFQLPTFDGGTPPAYDRNNGDSTPAVSAKASAKSQAAAFDFIRYYLANDEAMIDTAVMDGMAPSKKGLEKDPRIADNPALKVQADILERTEWPGPVPDVYFEDLEKYASEDILLNGKPIADSLANAAKQIKSDLGAIDFKSVEEQYQFASEMK